jgi:hypothetical protein
VTIELVLTNLVGTHSVICREGTYKVHELWATRGLHELLEALAAAPREKLCPYCNSRRATVDCRYEGRRLCEECAEKWESVDGDPA